MNDKKVSKRAIRYLKDEMFIEWVLCPTDELSEYWQHYSEDHPEEKENISKAKSLLIGCFATSYELDSVEKEEAVARLTDSLNTYYKHKKNVRKAILTFISSAAAVLLFILVYQNLFHKTDISEKKYYVGNILESEDIQLVTGSQTTTFEDNIDVVIGSDRLIQVKKENSDDTNEISVDNNTINRLTVPYGKRSKVLLPDGTRIWLNAGSTLIFPSTFGDHSREVKMQGEIFAEVAHDTKRPFIVKSGEISVRVYGTCFNLSTYESTNPWVVLVEGSVGVKSGKGKEMKLQPNERAYYDKNGNLNKNSVDVNNYVSWKDGYLTYQETPMIDVLRQIERYYNLSFNLDDHVTLENITCCGKIILSDNLDNVLTAMTLISKTRYHKENNSIYIYKK